MSFFFWAHPVLVLIVNIVGKWMVTEDIYNTINYNNYKYIKTNIKTSGKKLHTYF